MDGDRKVKKGRVSDEVVHPHPRHSGGPRSSGRALSIVHSCLGSVRHWLSPSINVSVLRDFGVVAEWGVGRS